MRSILAAVLLPSRKVVVAYRPLGSSDYEQVVDSHRVSPVGHVRFNPEDGCVSVPAAWTETRRALVLELSALSTASDILEWQRRLADAIIDAEHPEVGVDTGDAKRHRHLLRVIADGLVHAVLPEHTIRALSRHPGKPPSLSAQGADFDFVFSTARGLLVGGMIPVIADLTTLIGVGDIVGWNAEGVVVLECKNRQAPAREATTGRLARQRLRGEAVETYLTASHIDEGDLVRQAVTMPLPSPDWDAINDLLSACEASPSCTAAHSLGSGDILVAATSRAAPSVVAAALGDVGDVAQPAVAFYSDLIDAASYRLMAPSSYPVNGSHRCRLLERELVLVRLADLGALAAEFDHEGEAVSLVPERSDRARLRVNVDGHEYIQFTHQIAEFCLWMPVSVASLRDALIDYTRTLLFERGQEATPGFGPNLAPGDNFTYATVYRSQ